MQAVGETAWNFCEFKLFRCLKVGSTNQILEGSHMIAVKPNCVMH